MNKYKVTLVETETSNKTIFYHQFLEGKWPVTSCIMVTPVKQSNEDATRGASNEKNNFKPN